MNRLSVFLCLLFLATTAAFGSEPFIAGLAMAKYPNETYEIVKVADGVYAFIAPEPNTGVVQGNSTLIIGEESAMVVDSGQFPLLADRMIADIRKLTSKPVKYLLNTHWHGDHLLANVSYKKAWPGLTVISTGFTKKKIAEIYTEKFITEQPQKLDAAVKRIRTRVAEGKFSNGKVMTEEEKQFWTKEAEVLEHTLPEFRLWKYVPPEMTFEKEVALDLGKREVRLLWLGRGNTAGDAVTWIPDTKTLITGDTVVYPTPYGFGSYYSEWPAVLQKMIDLNAAAIVPGHGPLMHDYAYFHDLIALFNDVTERVKKGVAEGKTQEQLVKEITLVDWKAKLAGGNKQRQLDFDNYFVQPAIPRAYQEATKTWKEEEIE